MHLYTKKYIDTLVDKALFKSPQVNLIRWTNDDIARLKLQKKSEIPPEIPENDLLENKNEFEPPEKKQKVDESGKNILKLVLSREGETDTFKSQFKTVDDDKENGKKKNKKNEKKINKKNNKDIEKKNTKYDSQNNEKKKNEKNNQDNKMLIDCESSNSSIEPMEIVCDNTLESAESKTSSNIGKIWLCNINKLMDTSRIEKYFETFGLSHKIPKPSKSNEKKSSVTNSKSSNAQNSVQTKSLPLSEIECLYHKYFTKSVQDNIVIIANILNIISMSNKHHKSRMDESFKKKTEAEKLKERCDANRMHLRHKKILESKLKKYFLEVISEFVISEFEPAFQMFFLSILTVLRVLDQPKFKKGSIFKNLVLLLWNSLKNSDLDHAKVFGMFRSKTFRPDCIDLISLIEDSRDSDPGITDRMALFFVSSVNSQEYFQAAVNAVTSDSNEDLALLIDNAAFQCCINSKFKGALDLPSTSTVKKNVMNNTPVITPVPSTSKSSEDSFQRWVLAKTPNGTFQPVSMTDSKAKKKTPIIIDPSKASQQLNNFYEDFSNSLARGSTTTVVPLAIVSKGTTITTSTPVSNGPLQSGTVVTFKQPIQPNVKTISNSNFPRPEGNTIFVGNKQYHVIRSPMNQIRAVTSQNGIVMASIQKPEVAVRCFSKNCQNAATIMCSTCRSVKYCSHNCQRLDWYESHINNCERLNNLRESRQDT